MQNFSVSWLFISFLFAALNFQLQLQTSVLCLNISVQAVNAAFDANHVRVYAAAEAEVHPYGVPAYIPVCASEVSSVQVLFRVRQVSRRVQVSCNLEEAACVLYHHAEEAVCALCHHAAEAVCAFPAAEAEEELLFPDDDTPVIVMGAAAADYVYHDFWVKVQVSWHMPFP